MCVLLGGLLSFQDFTFEYGVMGPRKRVFTEEYMATFDNYHKTYMGRDAPVPKMGYPDSGAGYYSRQLPYKDWYQFNCAQRVHGNSIEHLSWLLPMVLVSGVFQPQTTALLTSTVIVGRELYRMGYLSKDGPNSQIRELGAYPLNIAEIVMIMGLGSIWFRKRYVGLLKNRKFYKNAFVQRSNLKLKEVEAEIKNEKSASIKIWRDQRSMLPMHPKVMKKARDLPSQMGMPGDISPNK